MLKVHGTRAWPTRHAGVTREGTAVSLPKMTFDLVDMLIPLCIPSVFIDCVFNSLVKRIGSIMLHEVKLGKDLCKFTVIKIPD